VVKKKTLISKIFPWKKIKKKILKSFTICKKFCINFYKLIIGILIIILFVSSFIFLISIKTPLLTLFSFENTIFYVGLDINEKTEPLVEDFFKTNNIAKKLFENNFNENINFMALSQVKQGEILVVQPHDKELFFINLETLYSGIETKIKSKMLYSYPVFDLAFIYYKDYVFISKQTSSLTKFIEEDSVSIAKHKDLSFLNILLKQSFLEGYVNLELFHENFKQELEEEKEIILDTIFTQVLKDKIYVFNAKSKRDKIVCTIETFMPMADIEKGKVTFFSFPSEDDVFFASGLDFVDQFEDVIASNNNISWYFKTYVDYLNNLTNIDFVSEILRFTRRPYSIKLQENNQGKLDLGVFLLGFTRQEDMKYIEQGLVNYMATSKPKVRNITLEDGTKGQELYIDTLDTVEREMFDIEEYRCTKIFIAQQDSTFIYCLTDKLTLVGTSLKILEDMINGIKYSDEGYEIVNGYTKFSPHIFTLLKEEYREAFNSPLFQLLSFGEDIELYPSDSLSGEWEMVISNKLES